MVKWGNVVAFGRFWYLDTISYNNLQKFTNILIFTLTNTDTDKCMSDNQVVIHVRAILFNSMQIGTSKLLMWNKFEQKGTKTISCDDVHFCTKLTHSMKYTTTYTVTVVLQIVSKIQESAETYNNFFRKFVLLLFGLLK